MTTEIKTDPLAVEKTPEEIATEKAAAEKLEKEKKPQPKLLSVYAQVQYTCPACGEIVLAETKDGINELELTPENEYRTELPRLEGSCDACKEPVYREKTILFYHGKR